MTQAVSHLLDEFIQLPVKERAEFMALAAFTSQPKSDDWTDDDFSALAAQTFARLDAEEEYARTNTEAR